MMEIAYVTMDFKGQIVQVISQIFILIFGSSVLYHNYIFMPFLAPGYCEAAATPSSQNTDTDPNNIFPKVRSDCDTCNCGYVKDTSIEFIGCHESHRYICEYKGGPSCPDGMFSLYGKCLGFVKNIMDDNTANDKTCNFQSGAVHNYRLAQVENVQVQLVFYCKLYNFINSVSSISLFFFCRSFLISFN